MNLTGSLLNAETPPRCISECMRIEANTTNRTDLAKTLQAKPQAALDGSRRGLPQAEPLPVKRAGT
ncbi:hypothetical protein OAF37_04310 [Rubripirellula sp.]|nr:hypothetical protein [Rubripirellula sp.]